MGVAAILIQMKRISFIHPTSGGSSEIFALIGQAVSEKMFEHFGRLTDNSADGHQSMGILLAKLVSLRLK